IRSSISPAAFRVKVIATIASGLLTMASSRRNRWISNSVLPEPAGARTVNDCVGSRAARRDGSSSWCRMTGLLTGFVLRSIDGAHLGDPAQRVKIAQLARLRSVLRIHRRVAPQETGSQVVDYSAPLRLSPGERLACMTEH